MSNIEFRNNLTEVTSVKGKKERTQYGALGDSERENYRLRETITYFNFFVFGLKGMISSTTRQYHLDQTSHASSHIKGNDQSCQMPLTGLIMSGPLPFLSPLRKLYPFEFSTARFQWSGNSYKQTG